MSLYISLLTVEIHQSCWTSRDKPKAFVTFPIEFGSFVSFYLVCLFIHKHYSVDVFRGHAVSRKLTRGVFCFEMQLKASGILIFQRQRYWLSPWKHIFLFLMRFSVDGAKPCDNIVKTKKNFFLLHIHHSSYIELKGMKLTQIAILQQN